MNDLVAKTNDATVITLQGELDVNNVEDLKTVIESELSDGTGKILIDLNKVTYMDSAALGVLVAGLKRARLSNAQFKLANVKGNVENIFKLTRLTKFFEIYNSVDSAMESF
ncbi:MAG: STAS domain-containing protein [Deferribacteres bacterium]|nr:STAS domain-containing protein [candidate division KSB1 bacterium]MCB9501953.1 STAS domain-containing protein [Deferribacteres bacterium]